MDSGACQRTFYEGNPTFSLMTSFRFISNNLIVFLIYLATVTCLIFFWKSISKVIIINISKNLHTNISVPSKKFRGTLWLFLSVIFRLKNMNNLHILRAWKNMINTYVHVIYSVYLKTEIFFRNRGLSTTDIVFYSSSIFIFVHRNLPVNKWFTTKITSLTAV